VRAREALLGGGTDMLKKNHVDVPFYVLGVGPWNSEIFKVIIYFLLFKLDVTDGKILLFFSNNPSFTPALFHKKI
jgi:hypothetical protein